MPSAVAMAIRVGVMKLKGNAWRAPALLRHTKVMAIFIVRLGTPRNPGEGVRIGTVRRPPRGVPKSDFARLNYYDVWFPNLSPSAELVQVALGAADQQAW